jgi:hexosaminidase
MIRRKTTITLLAIGALAGSLVPALGAGLSPVAAATSATSATISIVPEPVSLTPEAGVSYQLRAGTDIAAPGSAHGVGEYLAGMLRTDVKAQYRLTAVPAGSDGAISFALGADDPVLGDEGYLLNVTDSGVAIRANDSAGLFYGAETLLQLISENPDGTLPGVDIVDYPRYAYRGAMLDVARHFFTVSQVETYINEIALYKINYLHLHLSDDQGWRIAINGWPRLTSVGGSSGEGGGPGGYYTQAQYREIVAYAQARNVTIVPEIDVPAHSGSELSSYADLNCDDKAAPLYTGSGSDPDGTLCVGKSITYTFLNDVIGQLASLTPGQYIDVGGDEASSLTTAQYDTFAEKVQAIVAAHHKKLFGWAELLTGVAPKGVTGEFWIYDGTQTQVATASEEGADLIMAPCIYTYLDQKYAADTPPDPLGLDWAGYISVQQAYSWDPTTILAGVPDSSIFGVEAPLWTDTVRTLAQAQYMTFPRLPAIAEIGWSPESTHNWTSFSQRLGAQAPLWAALGIDYYQAPGIPWQTAN